MSKLRLLTKSLKINPMLKLIKKVTHKANLESSVIAINIEAKAVGIK